ncbi:MAG: hypothetical protein CFE35_17555 [Novosphingobium sp. PASSN1]|nr:MAG: hypothetical protein CFE35_17555 [Novosphingobium sp. PASSN1]
MRGSATRAIVVAVAVAMIVVVTVILVVIAIMMAEMVAFVVLALLIFVPVARPCVAAIVELPAIVPAALIPVAASAAGKVIAVRPGGASNVDRGANRGGSGRAEADGSGEALGGAARFGMGGTGTQQCSGGKGQQQAVKRGHCGVLLGWIPFVLGLSPLKLLVRAGLSIMVDFALMRGPARR